MWRANPIASAPCAPTMSGATAFSGGSVPNLTLDGAEDTQAPENLGPRERRLDRAADLD
jgi:hypothetical protein